jgi:hypothetical protein
MKYLFVALLLLQGSAALPEVEEMTELDRATWEVVTTANEFATKRCQEIDEVKRYNAIFREKRVELEKRHNGFTFNPEKLVFERKK